MAGYKKRTRIMVTGVKAFSDIMDYLSDLGVMATAVSLRREDGEGDIYWIRFKAELPLFEKTRKIAKEAGDLIATTGYGH